MKNYNAIDLFSGAGGLSYGFECAGFNILLGIDNDEKALETFELNHKNAKSICGDITEVSYLEDIKPIIGDKKIDVIIGGPPCQGMSLSGPRKFDDPRNKLYLSYIRLVEEIRPDAFVIENVPGLVGLFKGQIKDSIIEKFTDLGYSIQYKILCAADYGVPQNRNRFFMVGNRLGIDFKFPEKQATKITVEEAIGDLPSLQNGEMLDESDYTIPLEEASPYAQLMRKGSDKARQNYVSRNNDLVIERYKYIGQGQNWRAIPDFLMQNYADKGRCHSGIYKRLRADQPSVVISNYRKSMLIHPYEDRGISVREAARLQSFPDTFIFEGPLMHIQQQIGNAVPPLLAKAVFQQIIKQTKEHEQR